MSAENCVGFADCPCGRCRGLRREATARHGEHAVNEYGYVPDASYCGGCRTEAMNRNYRPVLP